MANVTIKEAKASDVAQINKALRHLSDCLGDTHRAHDEDILKYGFGTDPIFRSAIAEHDGSTVGVILFSPVFSTTRGGPGLYISDLWVSDTQRGTGLGRQLLKAACKISGEEICYLKLAAYSESKGALEFYRHLGFQPIKDENQLILEGNSFNLLKGTS